MIAWRPLLPSSLSLARAADAAPEREPQEEVGEQRDRPDEDADDQREPDVEVADVGQLVAHDALELLPVELLEQAGRDRDRCVLRVATGREGVRGGVVDDVDLGHRRVRRDRQLLDDVHELRRGRLVDLVRAGHLEDEGVAGEVRARGDRGADAEGDHHDEHGADRVATDRVADREAEQREQDHDDQRQQERVPPVRGDLVVEGVGHGGLSSAPGCALRQVVGPVGPLRFRSTTGVAEASGSASKNSRFENPNGPAISRLGNVAMLVL